LRSATLGRAAGVVRAGFMASYERDKDAGITVDVIETGDAAEEVLAAYNAAAMNADIVVGPLSRSGAALVAQRAVIAKPTIVLASHDALGDGAAILPANMLAIGLSVEEEARQAARWAAHDIPGGKAFVIATGTAWQQRAARAFADQWRREGLRQESMALSANGGYLDPNAMLQLIRRIQAERPDLVFVALDMVQTRQLREALGTDIAIYGTSQVNPVALPDWPTAQPQPLMDGVRLIDLPWQLLSDHPAVMATPRLAVEPDQRRSADLERLYALGVDAWRVAHEIALNRTRFAIDGVTGKLEVDFGSGQPRFERQEAQGIYQDGVVVPFAAAR
jgi:outer membrane PBP1 activator LpoA protein